MTTKRVLVLIACVFLAAVTFVLAQDLRDKLEGWKPYTPTRLEWLAVDLNATRGVRLTLEEGFAVRFDPIEKEDCILISVLHFPTVNRKAMNTEIEWSRKIILTTAKRYGWDKWLKIKEDIQMVNK